MSHELRTPLNSSLILAKLLATNKDGNLDGRAGEVRDDDLRRGQRPARPHQRHPRPLEDRGGQARRPARRARSRRASSRTLREALSSRSRARRSSRSTSRIDDTRAAGDRDGHPAPPADPEEPALERAQVHRVRRGLARRARGRRRCRRSSVTRHGHRHRAGAARGRLRGVPPGRRARPTAGSAAPGSASRSRASLARLLGGDLRVESELGRGQHLHAHAPARLRRAPRRRALADRPSASRARRRRARAAAPRRAPASVADDRERSTPSRRTGPRRRGRPRLRGDPARPRARARLPVPGRHHGRRGRRARARAAPERHLARHEAPGPLRASRCSIGSSATRSRGTSRCTSSPSPTTRRRRSSMGAAGYVLKPVAARRARSRRSGKLEDQFSRRVRRVLIVEDDARQRESIAQPARRGRRRDRRA